MTLEAIQGLLKECQSLRSKILRKKLFLSAGGSWIIYWVAASLENELRAKDKIKVSHVKNPWELRLKNQLLHFVSRQQYLYGDFRNIDTSNDVFLSWFHGDIRDPHPGMRRLFDLLKGAEPLLKNIVVPCKITLQNLVDFGMPKEKLVLIPIGVDQRIFRPIETPERIDMRSRLDIPENAICIGSFQKDGDGWGEGMEPKWVKAPEVFVEAIRLFSIRYSNIVVLLTGPARGFVKESLKKIGVRFIHNVEDNYHDIAKYYSALDIYLISSRCEGGPSGFMESWASGVPVVSTRAGMPADWIRHRKNGMISDIDDAKGLSENLANIIEDDKLRERIKTQSILDVKTLFWSNVAERHFEELYKPCL